MHEKEGKRELIYSIKLPNKHLYIVCTRIYNKFIKICLFNYDQVFSNIIHTLYIF